MPKDLIINAVQDKVNIALLEDKKLMELNAEESTNNYSVGDVYLGKVKKIIPGLNAAFVDVGYEKDAFLHYLDLGPQVRSLQKFIRMGMNGRKVDISSDLFKTEKDIDKAGKISNILDSHMPILVQIAKEPISTKGPRISSEISFPGRYLVLVPFSDRVSVSQKIKNPDERKRLKSLVQSIKPQNFGVIIRTVAENRKVAELDSDLRSQVKRWEEIAQKLPKALPTTKMLQELDRSSIILRDMLSEEFNSVWVNSKELFEELRNYMESIAPDRVDIVKLYTGKDPIFEHFEVSKQIKSSFGKKITIKNGAYLIIEHTEALHVVDVNSGHRISKDKNQEENALQVNLHAAAEIARQLRLRDMGGIIVIDFIDMTKSENRKKLFEDMKDLMKTDTAKHTVLPPTKFGLIQITRQRVRPEMEIQTLELCPVCNGTGKARPSIVIIEEIENNLAYLSKEQNEKKLRLSVHPFVYSYLTKGFKSILKIWKRKYKVSLKLESSNTYHLLEYHFWNTTEDEIKM